MYGYTTKFFGHLYKDENFLWLSASACFVPWIMKSYQNVVYHVSGGFLHLIVLPH